MKIRILDMPQQQPADHAYIEEEGVAPTASPDARGDRNREDMNRRRSPVARIPAVVWSGAMAFLLSTFAGAVWSVVLIINTVTAWHSLKSIGSSIPESITTYGHSSPVLRSPPYPASRQLHPSQPSWLAGQERHLIVKASCLAHPVTD